MDPAEEIRQLRGAIKRAGFAVMQTSGDWLICDVSKAAEIERAKTDKIIVENIELRIACRDLLMDIEADPMAAAYFDLRHIEAARAVLTPAEPSHAQ